MKYQFSILSLIISPLLLLGQEKLNKLSTPTSPASSIMGLQPATVLSPKSYQALETALYSNFMNSEGKAVVPNDFALEFTPYWTKNHSLSLEEYLYPKIGLDQIMRNSSFSIASTQNFILGDSTISNALAFGYRTTFYLPNSGDVKKVRGYVTTLKNSQSILIGIGTKAIRLIDRTDITTKKMFLDTIKKTIVEEIGKYNTIEATQKISNQIINDAANLLEFNKDDPDSFLNAFYNLIDSKIDSETVFTEFEFYIKKRQGFSLDVAYAGLINFPTSNFEFSILPRHSFWLTPTYRFKDEFSKLKIMGVLRYEWYNQNFYQMYFPQSAIYQNNTDLGLAISGEFQKFSIQFEGVGRSSNSEIPAGTDIAGNKLFRKEKSKDFQYIGSFSYNLKEQIVLTYSIGNRFDPIQNPGNTLVSLLTLNFGFGSPIKATLDVKK
jgi:hypothetical protein